MIEPTFTELVQVVRQSRVDVEAASDMNALKAALLPLLDALEQRYVGRAKDYGELGA